MAKRIKHIANMRDLGGIPVEDGKQVIPGRLIRGGHLAHLDERDLEQIKDLNMALIIDLRSPSELEARPDIVPEGAAYLHFPSLTNEQNPSINRHNRTSELKRIMKMDGGAVGHLCELYRLMITQEMSRESHRNLLLNLMEQEDGAVYWHCTQGKDRTGVAAAVILMALGATKEEILKDYLNEKRMLKFKNGFLTTMVGIILFNRKARTNLSVLMNAKFQCMEAALDEVEKTYGDMNRYIRDGLGISELQILKLREMYLQ